VSDSLKTDLELIKAVVVGDKSALGQLYLRYGNIVLRFLMRILKDRESAEDLCQDVFLTVAKIAVRYEDQGKMKSWLLGIASNKARSHQKKVWLRKKLMKINSLLFARYDSPAPYNEIENQISSAFQQLPIEQREILTLQIGEGLSGEEIAEVLSISHNAVRVRLHRARQNLRLAIGNKVIEEVRDE
jgi:RNA polymerase sigma-70 factor, ECF subfamily